MVQPASGYVNNTIAEYPITRETLTATWVLQHNRRYLLCRTIDLNTAPKGKSLVLPYMPGMPNNQLTQSASEALVKDMPFDEISDLRYRVKGISPHVSGQMNAEVWFSNA